MSVPGDVIYDGKDFDMKLEAKPSATSLPLKGINGGITWTLSGTGTLTLVSCSDMKEGVQVCRMRYSAGLTAGQTKLIKLQAVHDSTKETSSDTFTVATQNFTVSVPARINANTTFTATITAVDPTGATNTNYTGTVGPYLALMPGRPNIDEISNFVNGVATVQMQIHKPAWQMQLVVYDKLNPINSGTSNTFRVVQADANYTALDLVAVPITATSNRLSWTYLDSSIVSQYRIYRKDSTGIYQLIFTETTTTKSYYVDSALATGTAYDYKVEAVNASSSVISTDFASSTPKACTLVSSSPIGYTVWTKAQSPYCGSIALSITSSLVLEPGTIVIWNGGGTWSGGGQLLKAIGTPNERIIITSSSATPTGGNFPGFGVTASSAAVLDGSGNYVSGSLWKYVVIEYGGGGYWQASAYAYQSFIFRYASSNGFVFENSNTTLDGGVFARNTVGFSTKGPQTSKLNNLIFFRNSSDVAGAFFIKTDAASSAYSYQVTGNYFAYNSTTASTVLPGGALTLDPQAPGTTAVGGTYQITDNQFYYNSNQAQGFNGGAIRAGLYGTPTYTISNNTFVSNSSANGGAISVENAAGFSITMNNNLFQQNSATTNGGGVRVAGGSAAITATNNQFISNTSVNGKNFYNGVAQNHNLQNSYFDAATDLTCAVPQRTTLGVADSCGGASGTVSLTGVAATQYPLCINDPAVSGCVGAR